MKPKSAAEKGKGKGMNKRKREREILSVRTYVYDVPILVDHDVAIVTILDLQQIPYKRIGRHGLDEIRTCRLKLLGTLVAILMLEVFG